MSSFLEICEKYNPENTEDPKWELFDYLKSKGVFVTSIRNTDMLYIDTGKNTIAIHVSSEDEDAENLTQTSTYDVDKEVEGLSDKASSGLKGLAAKGLGTSAQKAKTAVKQRQNIAGKAVDVYIKNTQKLSKSIDQMKRTANSPIK